MLDAREAKAMSTMPRESDVAPEPANKVQLAVSHWKPRFVANGVDVNDFERVQAMTTEWADWAPNWKAVGDMHRELAEEADARGHRVTATDAFARAACSYHLGKFLWFEDLALHLEMSAPDRRACYARALPHLDPPGERLDIPFEGTTIPGHLRRPRGVARPPVVLIVPGLDSVKEELARPSWTSSGGGWPRSPSTAPARARARHGSPSGPTGRA